MDKESNPEAEKPAEQAADNQDSAQQTAPANALERTNEDLQAEAEANAEANGETKEEEPPKKVNPVKAFFRKVNVYLLFFLLIVIVAAVTTIVGYLNSQKAPPVPVVASQELTQDALKDLANTDATVGAAAQTLTVQGNAVFSGKVLIRSDLNVAGGIQLGNTLLAPSLTVSGASNLNDTQVNSLQVAQNVAIQGTTTLRDLNVAGTTSFGGPVTASQITVNRLILSGNAVLQIPNHVAFSGASPGRTINNAALGSGGTASVDGSDTSGTVSINSGNNPSAGCFVNITFNRAFSSTPRVTIGPVGPGAGRVQAYVTRSTTGFSICGNVAAPGGSQFGFDYFVAGN